MQNISWQEAREGQFQGTTLCSDGHVLFVECPDKDAVESDLREILNEAPAVPVSIAFLSAGLLARGYAAGDRSGFSAFAPGEPVGESAPAASEDADASTGGEGESTGDTVPGADSKPGSEGEKPAKKSGKKAKE